MNTIIKLSELFEKLINEKGSSTLQKDRADFFKERLSFLESDYAKLISNNHILESKNAELDEFIRKLQEENKQFKDKIEKIQNNQGGIGTINIMRT